MDLNELYNQFDNPWYYAYWFSRELISKDKYIDIGNNPKLLTLITSTMKTIANDTKPEERLDIQKHTLYTIIKKHYCKEKTRDTTKERVNKLIDYLDKTIVSQAIMNVFIATCDQILKPLKEAISNIPSNDLEYTKNIAEAYLESKGIKGLEDIILLWDSLGVKGCLNAERTEIIRAFATLRILLSNDNLQENEKDIVLTGFMQEFERRVAQKRKTRAGGSLENVTKFILDYFKIKRANGPQHIKIDLEVDNWISVKSGWFIGISCKRTFRERWKQVMSASDGELKGYNIKYILHIITLDEDISNDKIRALGSRRHIIFLPDKSERLKEIMRDDILKENVKPISSFIDFIKEHL